MQTFILPALSCYPTLHCHAAAIGQCKLQPLLLMGLNSLQAADQQANAACKGEGSDIVQLTLQTWQPMTSCASCQTPTTSHCLPEGPGASLPEGTSESMGVEQDV